MLVVAVVVFYFSPTVEGWFERWREFVLPPFASPLRVQSDRVVAGCSHEAHPFQPVLEIKQSKIKQNKTKQNDSFEVVDIHAFNSR